MSLTKSTQNLHRDVLGLGLGLGIKRRAVELVRIAGSDSAIMIFFCALIDFLGCHYHLGLSDYSLNENGCFRERP